MGKRAIELAAQKSSVDLELEWKPFMLDPSLPRTGVDKLQHYTRKFGARARAVLTDPENMLNQRGRPMGIEFVYHEGSKVFNTFDGHRLLEVAKAKGGLATQNAVQEVLFRKYFKEGANLADKGQLTAAAEECGLSAADVEEAVSSKAVEATVGAELEQSHSRVSGVPHFYFPSGQETSGGESVESFQRALAKC